MSRATPPPRPHLPRVKHDSAQRSAALLVQIFPHALHRHIIVSAPDPFNMLRGLDKLWEVGLDLQRSHTCPLPLKRVGWMESTTTIKDELSTDKVCYTFLA
eukprot:scaffold2631_cov373-Pavlova_lutheri.AAC.11